MKEIHVDTPREQLCNLFLVPETQDNFSQNLMAIGLQARYKFELKPRRAKDFFSTVPLPFLLWGMDYKNKLMGAKEESNDDQQPIGNEYRYL